MFKLQNKTIHISRLEYGRIIVHSKTGTAIESDVKELRIYNKDALDEEPICVIDGSYVDSNKTSIYFELGEFTNLEETKIERTNEPIEYWYEIRISGKIVVGYDDTKAKVLYLYPAGIDEKTSF